MPTRGFVTLEILIALMIMLLTLSAVAINAFGIQTSLITSETNAEAMNLAEELLEHAQALGRKDFDLVNSAASTTDGIYEKALYTKLLPDQLTKEVTATIAWQGDRAQPHFLSLTTLIANFETPVGGSTCDSTPTGNWQNIVVANSTTDFADLVGDPGATYTLSDVDAYRGMLYVSASQTPAPTKETLFVFSLTDPENPMLVGKVDNGASVSAGLTALHAAEDPLSSPIKTYVYAASASGANYTTCDPVLTPSCGQLALFDVSNPTSPSLAMNLMLPSSTPPFVLENQAQGNSIFYRNGYLLLGLRATGSGNGPEFHVLDVHGITAMLPGLAANHLLTPVGSYAMGHTINALLLKDAYAYLATPHARELTTLSLTDPENPALVGNYDNSVGGGNGKSIALVGDTLYLGKTVPNTGDDFHILNNAVPESTLPALGGANVTESVNDILIRDHLAFLLMNTTLEVKNVEYPTGIITPASFPLPVSGSGEEPSMDCEGNRLYVVSNDNAGKGALFVLKPS